MSCAAAAIPAIASAAPARGGSSATASHGPAAVATTGFEALAKGDLDGDTTEFSYFVLTGNIAANKQLARASQVHIVNEFE